MGCVGHTAWQWVASWVGIAGLWTVPKTEQGNVCRSISMPSIFKADFVSAETQDTVVVSSHSMWLCYVIGKVAVS